MKTLKYNQDDDLYTIDGKAVHVVIGGPAFSVVAEHNYPLEIHLELEDTKYILSTSKFTVVDTYELALINKEVRSEHQPPYSFTHPMFHYPMVEELDIPDGHPVLSILQWDGKE